MTSIFELSKEIKEIELDIKEKTEEHKMLINSLSSRKNKLQSTLNNHLEGLDADKMDRGSSVVYVQGEINTQYRKKVLKEAIEDLLNNSGKKLQKSYFGVKIYSGFGEQGSDHEYGMCPTYGDIVFEIGICKTYRNNEISESLLEDAIYYLANISK